MLFWASEMAITKSDSEIGKLCRCKKDTNPASRLWCSKFRVVYLHEVAPVLDRNYRGPRRGGYNPGRCPK